MQQQPAPAHGLDNPPPPNNNAVRQPYSPRIAPIMEEAENSNKRPALIGVDSSETTSSEEYYDGNPALRQSGPAYLVEGLQHSSYADSDGRVTSNATPVTSTSAYGWSASAHGPGPSRLRNGNGADHPDLPPLVTPALHSNQRPTRPPNNTRQPSNAYNPARRPHQFSLSSGGGRHRTQSTTRARKIANQEYHAQEKAYVQRIRQQAPEGGLIDTRPPDLDYTDSSGDSGTESPNSAEDVENPYDQETLLYYGNDDMLPSVEELRIPENRERLEWHSMLASVLTGDVVKQEKKRLIGTTEQPGDSTIKAEVWVGIRARTCGRTIAAQKRMVEEGRRQVKATVEAIATFEIQGEAEAGKTALEQVQDIVKKIEKIEGLWPTRGQFQAANPLAASQSYKDACDAVIAWHNTTETINTELAILQQWVGNEELDFTKPKSRPAGESDDQLFDDSSFIDRILKEDGLKSLQGDRNLLAGVDAVIKKAKETLISNAEGFADRHLPPYIEELLTLINFPSRLIQEIIKMRLNYAKNMKDAQQSVVMVEQMMSQFQILLKLAVRIKEGYNIISQAEAGWDLPPCIDENFDSVALDALKFYFRILNWKLVANMNTFKEAEILEAEWSFSNDIGRHFEGGDVEIAEQFSILTSKSLSRLTVHFEKDLQKKPEELPGAEMDRRYKNILDSVRVRQRKIFRFSRLLTQRFENATEYSINLEGDAIRELLDSLIVSGHFLVETEKANMKGSEIQTYVIASPVLHNRSKDIQSLLRTCYRPEDNPDDPTNPYVLILRPESSMFWDGPKLNAPEISAPQLDLKVGYLRLIADGPQARLASANLAFMSHVGHDLNVISPQRANLSRVHQELQKIRKTTYKLSNTIMDSVEIVRKQTVGLECQELIQTCFAFATEFGNRSILYMDPNRRAYHNLKMTRLALDWVSFICDDCTASDRKTFRWAVVALEFAMIMTRGQNILSISEEEYARLRTKVGGCMSLLISHFDIMGARSTVAAQAEKQRLDALNVKLNRFDVSKLKDDEESSRLVSQQWALQLKAIDEVRKEKEAERQALGRVLEDSNEADRALTYLSASAGNVVMRWQQGNFVGGGTFGSVWAAINLDTGHLMAVKEIRLQDPQMVPTIVAQIRDEMGVLQVLDHPNIVSYYGIEPHRDKVYIFMEYCSGGSLGNLLEHGRLEDETVVQVYALQMLEGLAYLHEAGVVHRDIKPENILLDDNGVIKFIDFGAAKVIAKQGRTMMNDARDGPQKSMTGTPMYMSPEVIKGGSTAGARHGASDIWSLGCVVLEMVTGRRPWASLDNEWAIMYNIAQGNPPQQPTPDQLSEQGLDFLEKCFEKDPSRRPSAAELLGHEWIMQLRSQLNMEPSQIPQTPTNDSGSGSSGTSSWAASRSNTGYSSSGQAHLAEE